MNALSTSYGLDAYRSHDLNIAMKTSSGDVIKLDFANEQSSSFRHSQNENGSSTSMSFSSMQSFQFSIESNGIDAQDQKEIDEFMKTAQPFIDDFLKELQEDSPNSPVTKLAREIASIFQPSKPRDENEINAVKTNIVQAFDNSVVKNLNELKSPTEIKEPQEREHEELTLEETIKEILEKTQKLLEKTLKEFEEFNKNIYA